MKLSEEQLSQFRTKGYLVLPDFFSPDEVHALQADVARLQQAGYLRNVRREGDGETPASGSSNFQLCPCSYYSALMRALPFERRTLEVVTSLIGDEIALHLDQIFLKSARTGKGTAWHQDNAYFKIDRPLRGTAMWIAVHEANASNGTMRLIPYAYQEALEHQRDPYSDHHIRCQVDESKAELLEVPAGGVAFFCYGTPHATGDNLSDTDRAGLAYHFLNVDQTSSEFFQSGRSKAHPHPFLTGPHATGGFREYGEDLSERWPLAVQAILDRSLTAA